MTDTAQAAADAARATRERALAETWMTYNGDVWAADWIMASDSANVTHQQIADCRTRLTACLAHLDELERLIAQRDGMPVSDGPDVGERRYG